MPFGKRQVPAGDAEHCHASALRMLEHRWCGEKELRKKLILKGYDLDIVGSVIERLRAGGFIDDERYAASRARALIRSGKGRHHVRLQLTASGVSHDDARDGLEKALDDVSESAALESLARKKSKALSRSIAFDWSEQSLVRKKLTAWLLQQGYEFADVEETVHRLARESISSTEDV